MDNPLVSIIIPVYKVEKLFDRCVDSVVNQTYQNIEIILVDDGSPDNCPLLCDEWASRDSRIKVIHKVNEGVSSARNIGLDICNGEYICFVDSDDWIETNMVEVLLANCLKYQVKLTICGRYDVFGEITTQFVAKNPCQNGVIDAKEAVRHMFLGKDFDSGPCGKLFHCSLWKNARFPFGKIFEDIAILYKVVLMSESVALVNESLYYYFRHSGSITTSPFSKALLDYPTNTRAIIEDLKNSHRDLYEYACWVHMKALKYVLERLAQSDNKTYKEYIIAFKLLSKELSSYKCTWQNSTVFSRHDTQLCNIFSCWYIIRPFMQFKKLYKSTIAKMSGNKYRYEQSY